MAVQTYHPNYDQNVSAEYAQTTYQGSQAAIAELMYPPQEDYIVIEVPNDAYTQVRNRAFVLLGTVALLVVLAIGLVMLNLQRGPGEASSATESGSAEAIAETSDQAVAPAAPAVAAAVDNGLSPVFSAEIQHWAPNIMNWSRQYGIDPDIIATIMQIESCGDPQAESWAGAQGLFQVMPFHFTSGEVMKDPETNAYRGMNYYNELMRLTNNDIKLSFAGYNGGQRAALSAWDNWHNETQRYYVWATGIYDDAKSGSQTSETLNEWLNAGGRSLCDQAAARLGINN